MSCALAVALIVCISPAAALAEAPQPLSPPDGYMIPAGSPPPTFSVSAGAGATDYLWVHVSTSPLPDSTGIIGSDVTLGELTPPTTAGVVSWTPYSFSFPGYWLETPGTYYWQPYRITYVDDPDGAQEGAIRRLVVTPAATTSPTSPPPVVTPLPTPQPPPAPDPYAGLSTQKIPRNIGFRNPHWSYYVSTSGRPFGVSSARWQALVRNAGSRWGMKYLGTTSLRPYVGDGESDVGFGHRPYGVLGTEIDLVRSVYRRYRHPRLVCDTRAAGHARAARCRYSRRKLIRRYYLDSDVVLDRSINWQPGPATPVPNQYDLETVVLHEMGHLAGNMHHVRRCRVSPMVEALDVGEWWRSTTDWNFNGCGLPSGRARLTGASGRRVFTHETRRQSVTVDAGRSGDRQLRTLDRAYASSDASR